LLKSNYDARMRMKAEKKAERARMVSRRSFFGACRRDKADSSTCHRRTG